MTSELLINYIGWVRGLFVYDFLHEGGFVARLEGRLPDHHLVNDQAQAPPIDLFSVLFLTSNLRGEVLGSSHAVAFCGRQISCEPKVCNFDEALLVDNDILWFQTEWVNAYSL